MNTKEQWEEDFSKLNLDWENTKSIQQLIDFIRETREQAYQKGLDEGYDEGFRACERGVTP